MLVYITFPTEESAMDMARQLVRERLVAGAHVDGPVFSVYRWQGQMHEAREWRLIAQTPRNKFEAFAAFVRAGHPYHTPCIVNIVPDGGYKPFLDWIERTGD